MSDVTFRDAWRKNDAEMERDAITFWQSRKSLLPPNVNPEERAREICALAYRDGKPIGVSTATVQFFEQFRSNMAVYRCAVSSELGHQPLSWRITDYSREVLERWSLANPGEKVMGLLAIIQAKVLVTRYPQVFGPANMTFTGFSQAGFPIRVAWFKHATIPTEWPPRPTQARGQEGFRVEPAGANFSVKLKGW